MEYGQPRHAAVTCRGRVAEDTTLDLDTAAGSDIVSIQFAKRMQLKKTRHPNPVTQTADETKIQTFGIWDVPITLTDFRGRTKTATRPCVAIDRPETPGVSPILLGVTGLKAMNIDIPARAPWRFAHESSEIHIEPPRKFAKLTRNETVVYAIMTTPLPPEAPHEEYPLGSEELENQREVALPYELQEYRDVFDTLSAAMIPASKETDHAIDLVEGAQPPHGAIYPLSERELEELRLYLTENLASGRIRPSKSPAGAPILFVPKKDGTLRLCVDYRGLNKITIKNRYALPLISEILDRINGAQFFSKLDIKDAYHRIRIKEGDEWKTAFRTRYGHYEYVVLPFGLTNAPATFQHYIHTALQGLVDITCVAYMDDVLVFSRTREEHTRHLREVLARLRRAQLYANPHKCKFFEDEVEFLGFIIGRDGVRMDSSRIATVREWPEPKSYRDVQVFLGFCNFYRRFIRAYSKIAAPLNEMMKGMQNGKKPGAVELTTQQRDAFEGLKVCFEEAPLLRHFDPARPLRLETDASKEAGSGVLSQPDDDGNFHPIAFWSRKWKGPELNYGTPDQEMMAIVESFKHWRQYLDGSRQRVEVLSDHANLRAFMSQQKLNGRQARWCMFLMPFDFEIKHQAGKRNPADAPSRRPDYKTEAEEFVDQALLPTLAQRLTAAQEVLIPQWERLKVQNKDKREEVAPLQRMLGEKPLWIQWVQARPQRSQARAGSSRASLANRTVWPSPLTQQFIPRVLAQSVTVQERTTTVEPSTPLQDVLLALQTSDNFCMAKRSATTAGTLRDTRWRIDDKGLLRYRHQVYIPAESSVRWEILNRHHSDPTAGHFKRARTKEIIQRKYYWPGMQKDINEFVDSCPTCQRITARRHKPYGELQPLPIPERPWQEISMDFVVGLPTVFYHGELVDSILVVVDRYTKMCRFLPVSATITSEGLARIVHAEIETRYGTPRGIVSDRGSVFTSQFWLELCSTLAIRRRLSTAWHPQTDGQTERINQILEHYLRAFVNDEQTNWPLLLHDAEFSVNNAVNSTIGLTPFRALYGYNPEMHIDVEDDATVGGVPAVADRIEKLQALRDKAEIHWRKAQEAHKKYYNKKRKPMSFQQGDLVVLSTQNLKLKVPHKKLAPRFIGPFKILERIGQQAYRLALPQKYDRLHNVFSISLLEPWKPRAGDKTAAMPLPALEEDPGEWEVEAVKDKAKRKGEVYYLVKWAGWPVEYNQWVPAEDMENAREVIQDYEKKLQKKKQK